MIHNIFSFINVFIDINILIQIYDKFLYFFIYRNILYNPWKEKTKGTLEGIIGSVYQTAFGEDIYPSIQEKLVNLLYFIVKYNPFMMDVKEL